MSYRYEIRFSGSGGQGLILAGVIFAEAATIYDKINAVQSQSYGPEARGGASKAEVIISEEVIDFPKATAIDLQLSLTQESCNKYYKDIKPDGILLVDEDFVRDIPQGNFKVIKLPIIRTASEEIGKAFVANIVATGVITAITGGAKRATPRVDHQARRRRKGAHRRGGPPLRKGRDPDHRHADVPPHAPGGGGVLRGAPRTAVFRLPHGVHVLGPHRRHGAGRR